MTRGTTEFTQQNSERAMQAANLGMNWALELAEQSLNQSKGVLDGLFNVTRKMTEEFDNQTSAIREHSTSLIEKTLSNTFDFGHKLARLSGATGTRGTSKRVRIAAIPGNRRPNKRARSKNQERNNRSGGQTISSGLR